MTLETHANTLSGGQLLPAHQGKFYAVQQKEYIKWACIAWLALKRVSLMALGAFLFPTANAAYEASTHFFECRLNSMKFSLYIYTNRKPGSSTVGCRFTQLLCSNVVVCCERGAVSLNICGDYFTRAPAIRVRDTAPRVHSVMYGFNGLVCLDLEAFHLFSQAYRW